MSTKVTIIFSDLVNRESYARDAKERYPNTGPVFVSSVEELKEAMLNYHGRVHTVNYSGTYLDPAEALMYARNQGKVPAAR